MTINYNENLPDMNGLINFFMTFPQEKKKQKKQHVYSVCFSMDTIESFEHKYSAEYQLTVINGWSKLVIRRINHVTKIFLHCLQCFF